MTKEIKTQTTRKKKSLTTEQSQFKTIKEELVKLNERMDIVDNIHYYIFNSNNGKFLRIFTFLFVILALILASFSIYLATDVKNTLKFYHQFEENSSETSK